MILAFLEGGTIELHDSVEDAVVAYEGVDVESKVATFYDDQGNNLTAVFSVPNSYGSIFGIFRWSKSGTYTLEIDESCTEDPLWLALKESTIVEDSGQYSNIEQLKSYLALKGVVIEQPDGA